MMRLKKTLLFFLGLTLLLMMTAACSGDKETTTVATTTKPATQATTAGTTTSTQTPATTMPGVTVESGTGQSGADIPDGYPADLFPIYKGSYITGVIATDGSYTIMAESKDDWANVAAFYKDVLKTAEVTSSMDTGSSFTSFGKIGAYTYNFDVSATDEPQMEGYETAIVIMLMP